MELCTIPVRFSSPCNDGTMTGDKRSDSVCLICRGWQLKTMHFKHNVVWQFEVILFHSIVDGVVLTLTMCQCECIQFSQIDFQSTEHKYICSSHRNAFEHKICSDQHQQAATIRVNPFVYTIFVDGKRIIKCLTSLWTVCILIKNAIVCLFLEYNSKRVPSMSSFL